MTARDSLASAVGDRPLQLLAGTGQRLSNSLAGLANALQDSGVECALLVIDRRALAASGLRKQLGDALSGVAIREFDAFSPNPLREEGAAAAELAAICRADAVIGVGGGSCLDVAKLAALAARTPEQIDALSRGTQLEHAQPLPLFAVPTTSGTGSEATHFAAIYVDGRKVSVAHPRMRPSCVVLDVRFHLAMPPRLAAVTGLDALAQAMESLWSVGATEQSIEFAMHGGRLVADNLVESCQAPSERARTAVMIGAHLAGHAINISKTTAAHAMSYQLTQRFGLAHGHAVALTLGHFAAANAAVDSTNCVDPRGPSSVCERVAAAASLLGTAAINAASAIHQLLRTLDLPSSLTEAGVDVEALDSLAQSVDLVRLANNPRQFTTAELKSILTAAL